MAILMGVDGGTGNNVTSYSVTAPVSGTYDQGGTSGDHFANLTSGTDKVVVVAASTYAAADSTYQFTIKSGSNTLTVGKDYFNDGILSNNYQLAYGTYGGDVAVTWTNVGVQTLSVWVVWVTSSNPGTTITLENGPSYTTNSGTPSSYTQPTFAGATYDNSVCVTMLAGDQPVSTAHKGIYFNQYGVAGTTTGETRCSPYIHFPDRAGDTWPGGSTINLAAAVTNGLATMTLRYNDANAVAAEPIYPVIMPTGDSAPTTTTTFGGGISLI